MKQLELDALLVTRGSIGMSMFLNDQVVNIPVESSQVFDVTGAGDTVIAFLAAGIAIGESYADSARLANLAASLSVQKRGSSSVPLAELLKKIEPNKIYSSLENMSLTKQVASYRSQGKKIVMTNGCFDILHAGHIKYLESAKKCGDVLIIAVNDDASVSALKGVCRPLNILEDRLTLLASLECVDMVVPFSEDTPINIIKSIRPDVLVKGGDYKEDNIVGADFVKSEGGEVKTIAFIKGKSTTNLINKIINDLA
jgi:D-beta-D-heptose 7-phosphate kinase/D-beta-D-heptose 1-phosphate adenosyltransferase